jgi:hypothetical protein
MNTTGRIAVALLAAATSLLAVPAAASAASTRQDGVYREDFDHLPLGPVTAADGWTTDISNGSMSIEPSSRGHGRDLHIHTDGNGHAFLVLSGPTPPGNSFWARLRLNVSAFPTAPNWAHWTIAEASGTGSPTLVRPLGGQYVPTSAVPASTGNYWGVGSDLGPTGDWTSWQTSEPAAARTWQCVEFHLDATDNQVTVYFDGVEQPDLTVSTTHHGGSSGDFTFPQFTKLKLGWQLYQANPTPAGYDIRLAS